MFEDITTPAFLVDLSTARSNAKRMLEKAARSRVTLRPHVKTHKTVEGARLQLGAERGPITVSTLAEAEFFADHGFSDITYAVPIDLQKVERAADLASRVERLNLLVDHPDAVRGLDEVGRACSDTLDVLVKVDCGYHRAGVDPSASASIDLVKQVIDAPHLRFGGLLTHAGQSYSCRSTREIRVVARKETEALNLLASRLSDAGLEAGLRSIGSTPTASVVDEFVGADEVRPGNYLFYDVFQSKIGSCTLDDCAGSVLVSVIGVYPERGTLIINGGALALSKDLGAAGEGKPDYGVVCDLDGQPVEGLVLESLSQEHGEVRVDRPNLFSLARPGTRFRILVNHSCLAAAMFDRYHVFENGKIVDEWHPCRGW